MDHFRTATTIIWLLGAMVLVGCTTTEFSLVKSDGVYNLNDPTTNSGVFQEGKVYYTVEIGRRDGKLVVNLTVVNEGNREVIVDRNSYALYESDSGSDWKKVEMLSTYPTASLILNDEKSRKGLLDQEYNRLALQKGQIGDQEFKKREKELNDRYAEIGTKTIWSNSDGTADPKRLAVLQGGKGRDDVEFKNSRCRFLQFRVISDQGEAMVFEYRSK